MRGVRDYLFSSCVRCSRCQPQLYELTDKQPRALSVPESSGFLVFAVQVGLPNGYTCSLVLHRSFDDYATYEPTLEARTTSEKNLTDGEGAVGLQPQSLFRIEATIVYLSPTPNVNPGEPIRINGGPNCRHAALGVSLEMEDMCKMACESLWNFKSEIYWECQDVFECFMRDFKNPEVLNAAAQFAGSSQSGLSSICQFERRPPLLRQQYSHSAILARTPVGSRKLYPGSFQSECNGSKNELKLVAAYYGEHITLWSSRSACEEVDITALVMQMCLSQKEEANCSIGTDQFEMLYEAAAKICPTVSPYGELRIFYDCRFESLGPHCYVVKRGYASLCSQACLAVWDKFVEQINDKSPSNLGEAFAEFWKRIVPEYFRSTASLQLINDMELCQFESRLHNTDIEQYAEEHYYSMEGSGSSITLRALCENFGGMRIVHAVVGPKNWVTYGETSGYDCTTRNVTAQVLKLCAEALNSQKLAEYKCIINKADLPSKEDICQREEVGLLIRYKCTAGWKAPLDYTCQALPVSDEVLVGSCGCANSAIPCTRKEAELSEIDWVVDIPEDTSAILMDHGIYSKVPGASQFSYTVTDQHRDLCMDSHNLVLCKSPSLGAPFPSRTFIVNCSESYSILDNATSADDARCEHACTAKLNSECALALNKWLCVTQAVPECHIANQAMKSCSILKPSSTYDEVQGSCSCPEGPVCDVEAVLATRKSWIGTYDSFADSYGVILARNNRAMWTNNSEKFYYENGAKRKGGCGRNPWIIGTFCVVQSPVRPQRTKDAVPSCSTSISRRAGITDIECRVRCTQIFEACKVEVGATDDPESKQTHSSFIECFDARYSEDKTLRGCVVDIVSRQNAGKAELQVGWVVVGSAWQLVNFSTKFDSPPVVVMGIPDDDSPFVKAIIKNVTKTDFEVKLFRRGCPKDVNIKARAVVSWMALPAAHHMPRNSVHKINVMTVTLDSPKVFTIPVHLYNMTNITHVVALIQVQSIKPENSIIEDIPIICTQLSHLFIDLQIALPAPFSFYSVKVGIVVTGMQDPLVYFGISPTMNRRRLQTFVMSVNGQDQALLLKDGISKKESKISHLFATVVYRKSKISERGTAEVLLSQKPEVEANLFQLVPWKRNCSSEENYTKSNLVSVSEIVGLYIEGLEDTPLLLVDNPEDPCTAVVPHSFYLKRKSGGISLCKIEFGENSLFHAKCKEKCQTLVDAAERYGCYFACDKTRRESENACIKKQKNIEKSLCTKRCRDILTKECSNAKDKLRCLRAKSSTAYLYACRFKRRRKYQETAQVTLEYEDEIGDRGDGECTIVDMSEDEFIEQAGWDSQVRTCKCPNGFHACQRAAVDSQLLAKDSFFEALKKYCSNQKQIHVHRGPVARGFISPSRICSLVEASGAQKGIVWQQIQLPPYSDLDFQSDTGLVKSGDTLCRSDWQFVFCPAKATTTSTIAPRLVLAREELRSILSEWEDWGACSGTCRTPDFVPVRSRKRFVLNATPYVNPVLSEHENCSNLPLCGSVCWYTEWTEWGECHERFLARGRELTQVRYRYVYEYQPACANEPFMDGRPCKDEGEVVPEAETEHPKELQREISTASTDTAFDISEFLGEDDFTASPAFVQKPEDVEKTSSNKQEEGAETTRLITAEADLNGESRFRGTAIEPNQRPAASSKDSADAEYRDRGSGGSLRIDWSGCEAPCLPHGGKHPLRYRISPAVLLFQSQRASTTDLVSPCDNLPPCSRIHLDCSGFDAGNDFRIDKQHCTELCKRVLNQCQKLMAEGKYSATSVERCLLNTFEDAFSITSRCPLPTQLLRERKKSKCFFSRTRSISWQGSRNTRENLFSDEAETPSDNRFSVFTSSDFPPFSSKSARQSEMQTKKKGETDSASEKTAQEAEAITVQSSSSSIPTLETFLESGNTSNICDCLDPDDEPCTAEEAYDSLQSSLRLLMEKPLCPQVANDKTRFIQNGRQTADNAVFFALKGFDRLHCPSALRRQIGRYAKSKKMKALPVTFTKFSSVKELREFCEHGLPYWDAGNLISNGDIKTDVGKEGLKSGKGIIICKRRESDCSLTEWTDWSACTDTCISHKVARIPLRSRSRRYRYPSLVTGNICSQTEDTSTVEVEECSLPECSDEEEINLVAASAYDIRPKSKTLIVGWKREKKKRVEATGANISTTTPSCYIADMSELPASLGRGYDEKYNTCRCPGNDSRPCSSAEVMLSIDRWSAMGRLLCNRDPTLTIVAQNMNQFHCALKSFRKLESNLTPDCTVQEYAYVFCTGEQITSAEISAVWLACLIFGLFSGACCVIFCIQHNEDVQKVLGLTSTYPRLVRDMHELSLRENSLRVSDSTVENEHSAQEFKYAEKGVGGDENSREDTAATGTVASCTKLSVSEEEQEKKDDVKANNAVPGLEEMTSCQECESSDAAALISDDTAGIQPLAGTPDFSENAKGANEVMFEPHGVYTAEPSLDYIKKDSLARDAETTDQLSEEGNRAVLEKDGTTESTGTLGANPRKRAGRVVTFIDEV